MEEIEGLDEFVRQFGQLKSVIRKLEEQKRKDGGWDVVAVAREMSTVGDTGLGSKLKRLANDAEVVQATLAPLATRRLLELEVELRDLCQQRDWHIDGEWPEFYVERTLQVSVDVRRRVVTVAGEKCPGCMVPAIAPMLDKLVPTLFPKNYTRQDFMDALSFAYDACRERGEQDVEVYALYKEILVQRQKHGFWRNGTAAKFSELTMNQFRARLTDTLENDGRDSKGRAIRLSPSLNPEDGLFLYQPGERRMAYIGFIELRGPEA